MSSSCNFLFIISLVASVQRGGRGKLNASAKRDKSAKHDRLELVRSRFALAFNFPLPPLCTPATQAIISSTKSYCNATLQASGAHYLKHFTMVSKMLTSFYLNRNYNNCDRPTKPKIVFLVFQK